MPLSFRTLVYRLDARLPRFVVTKRGRRLLAVRIAAAIEAAGEADHREDADGPLGYRRQALRAFGSGRKP